MGVLSLKRKPGESIQIGPVKVTIHRVKGNSVTLHVSAPPNYPVKRTDNLKDKDRNEGQDIAV